MRISANTLAHLVQWNIMPHHASQRVNYRGVRHSRRRIQIAIHLNTCAAEVKVGVTMVTIDCDCDTDWRAIIHLIAGMQLALTAQ